MNTYTLRKERREAWLASNGPCRNCGSRERLEVDHIDPKKKVAHAIWGWSEPRRKAELVKCQALCVACHRKKTSGENARQPFRGKTKLSRANVLAIYAAAKLGARPTALARHFGINHATVASIRDGKVWSHVTCGKSPAHLFRASGLAKHIRTPLRRPTSPPLGAQGVR